MLNFKYTYIEDINKKNKNKDKHIHLQLDSNSYAYLGSYSNFNNVGIKFTLERFNEEGLLEYKLLADFIRWDTTKKMWDIQNYYERRINGHQESINRGLNKDTTLNMSPSDFSPRNSDVEMLDYFELNEVIAAEKFKGSKKVVFFEIEKHKRIAFPFAYIILTFIGVSIASRKVRGGIGMHLGFGLLISFSFILFMKVTQTFATNAGLDPMLAMWIPNVLFSFLAAYLLAKAPK